MKNVMWSLSILVLGFSAIGYSRPGIVLRETGVRLESDFTGMMPEVRVLSNGLVYAGKCSAAEKQTCNLNLVEILSMKKMVEIQELVSEAQYANLVRWYSPAMCLRAPDFMVVFSASNSSLLLRDGDICLGGGMYRNSQAALELVALLESFEAKTWELN